MSKVLLKTILFILFFLCVLLGQKSVGFAGLGVMMIGIAGLLGLLWDYNRHYQ